MRALERFFRSNKTFIFREVLDSEEKEELIKLRTFFYDKKKVRKLGSYDSFDEVARFFLLTRKDKNEEKTSKIIRVVNRNSYGILPSELNLMSLKDLKEFYQRFYTKNHSKIQESTMSYEGRKNLEKILEKYKNSKTVYEAGGLSCIDSNLISPFALILAIGFIGFKEKWDLVIQTQHPKHCSSYFSIGFPYKRITTSENPRESYLDYIGRLSTTLLLEGQEFREFFENKVLYRIKEKIEFL